MVVSLKRLVKYFKTEDIDDDNVFHDQNAGDNHLYNNYSNAYKYIGVYTMIIYLLYAESNYV